MVLSLLQPTSVYPYAVIELPHVATAQIWQLLAASRGGLADSVDMVVV